MIFYGSSGFRTRPWHGTQSLTAAYHIASPTHHQEYGNSATITRILRKNLFSEENTESEASGTIAETNNRDALSDSESQWQA
jgi:hypothetical protein